MKIAVQRRETVSSVRPDTCSGKPYSLPLLFLPKAVFMPLDPGQPQTSCALVPANIFAGVCLRAAVLAVSHF